MFVYWLPCWEIPEICRWIQPIPVGDGWRCTCGLKKGWAAHRGKLLYDSGRQTRDGQLIQALPRGYRLLISSRSLATLKSIGLTQNQVGIRVTSRKDPWDLDAGVLKQSLYVKVDRWYAPSKLFFIKPRCMVCVSASNSKQTPAAGRQERHICFSIHSVCFSVTRRLKLKRRMSCNEKCKFTVFQGAKKTAMSYAMVFSLLCWHSFKAAQSWTPAWDVGNITGLPGTF